MILSTFRRFKPYKVQLFVAFAISCSIGTIIAQTQFVADIVEGGCPVPDACTLINGYSPQQAIDWYDSIGDNGRRTYIGFAIVDIFFIIPSYTLWLGSLLVDYNDYCPEIICYLPSITACFDLMETITHLYACLFLPSSPPPSIPILLIASAATQFKYLCLTLSLILVGLFELRQRMNQKSSSSSSSSLEGKQKYN